MSDLSIFKVLSDSQRRDILVMLKGGRLSAGEIAERMGLTPAALSYHLKLKSGSINGVAVKDYVIVYDKEGLDYNKRAAEYIQSEILSRTGHELRIVDDSAPAADNEIVVGETDRDISKALQADRKSVV